MSGGPEIAVIWCTITSGRACATASPTDAASSPSITTARAPSPSSRLTLASLVEVAVTSWPAATSIGSNRRPSIPLPPATNTFIVNTFLRHAPLPLGRDWSARCDIAPMSHRCHPASSPEPPPLEPETGTTDQETDRVHQYPDHAHQY